jgi:hypothetical protein
MFHPTALLIDTFVERLQQTYHHAYGRLEPHYAGILGWAGCMALENIANSDALYHNVEHTMLVTLVGQEILRGKHHREGGVSPQDWLHVVISLLCHDIGYVRGVLQHDSDNANATGIGNETIALPRGATDASMIPYHVDRGKCFIRDRFGEHEFIDAETIATNIERTRFPVPHDYDHQGTADYPGLVRAADLIGQLADPYHLRKIPALFAEFDEIGINAQLGYRTPDDFREDYPAFYWHLANRYMRDGLRHLQVTHEGKQWIANLYAHVFTMEHYELTKVSDDA